MDGPRAGAHRQVTCRMWTSAGWIGGTLHVPMDTPLLAFLNSDLAFLSLTNVKLPWQDQPLAFLALQTDAIAVVIPAAAELEGMSGGAVAHQVQCLLEQGVVMGTLRLPTDERVSDRLTRRQRFFLLRGVTLGLEENERQSVETLSAVVINGAKLLGVAET